MCHCVCVGLVLNEESSTNGINLIKIWEHVTFERVSSYINGGFQIQHTDEWAVHMPNVIKIPSSNQ